MAEYGEGTEGRRKWFIPLEKTILTALVEQQKSIVESKKRDGASNREKEKVWEVIAAQFSAHPSTQPRTSRELRRCWENMKARAKKALERWVSLGIWGGIGCRPRGEVARGSR